MPRRSTPRNVAHGDVEIRAYFAWLNRGASHGGDVEDWLTAEAAQRRSDAARQGHATRQAFQDAGRAATAGIRAQVASAPPFTTAHM